MIKKQSVVSANNTTSNQPKSLIIALSITTTLMVLFAVLSTGLGVLLFAGTFSTIQTTITRDAVLNYIAQEYIGEKPDTTVQSEGELKGLVQSLNDPYSQYLSKDETESFKNSLNEEYQGIGVRFMEDNGLFVITQVMNNSPAERAGLQVEDVLVSVDGVKSAGVSLEEVTTKIKGPQGTSVQLVFARGDEEKEFTIVREAIKSDLVQYTVADDIATIYIASFGDGVASQINTIAADITANASIKGIILDLRSNTGGLLHEGVDATSYFVDEGDVVAYEIGTKQTRDDVAKRVNNSLKEYPIAIVVDEYTASAAEIMAAAIDENRDATTIVVGQTTYGKGVVQKLFPLPNGGTLKLTVAEWLTPNRNKINKQGIEPEIKTEAENSLDTAQTELRKYL